MKEQNNKIDCGVPRPYSNKKLPTPKYILAEFFKPFNISSALFILFLISYSIIIMLMTYTNVDSNSSIILSSCIVALISIGISLINSVKNDIRSVPSIQDVSNTIKYVRASSRLSVLTIISGIITLFFIIISHVSDIFYFIDDSTRLTIIILMSLAYLGSYIIVKTLCSYSSVFKDTKLSLPVNISSIPEIVTIVGFIIPPLLVIFTGLIYNGPPIVDIPFSISLIDIIAILISIQLLYISLISRL